MTPAAAATLLYAHGIQSSEKEMAKHCGTTREGSTMLGMAKGLREKLPSRYRVRVDWMTPWEVRDAPKPLITKHGSGFSYHAWVIYKVRNNGRVEIGEGGFGRQVVDWDRFVRTFTGSTVLVTER